jgi:hypothetical protein
MKQNNISSLPALDATRYERLFDVYQDDGGRFFYNILKTVNFDQENMSPDIYSIHIVQSKETYNLISYKKYNTINLWWLICAFNGINNPTKLPTPGTQLKILNVELVNKILNNIS